MIIFDDSEIILQKALASKVVGSLNPVKQKLLRVCEKTSEMLFSLEESLKNSSDAQNVGVFSKQIKELQTKLILSLSLKNRVETLLKKNEERIDYFNDCLEKSGIYLEKFDRSKFSSIENDKSVKLTEESLNINPANNDYQEKRFVFNEVLLFVNGKLDFSLDSNKKILETLSLETLTKLIQRYPECVSTIPDDMFLNVKLKQDVLKAIAIYVNDELKSKSVKEVNKKLGGLLSFKTEITNGMGDYVVGVQNMIDAITKDKLMQTYPEKAQEIQTKLKCNEKSELIPQSKKVAILSQGLAGEVEKTDEMESEEVRINQEKENDASNKMIEEILASISEEKIEEQKEDDEKNKQEELKQNKREIEKKKEEEFDKEVEEMMKERSMSLSKHDD